MSEGKAVPMGWAWTTLNAIAEIVGGSTPSRAEEAYFGGTILWLTPTEVPKYTVVLALHLNWPLHKNSARALRLPWC